MSKVGDKVNPVPHLEPNFLHEDFDYCFTIFEERNTVGDLCPKRKAASVLEVRRKSSVMQLVFALIGLLFSFGVLTFRRAEENRNS